MEPALQHASFFASFVKALPVHTLLAANHVGGVKTAVEVCVCVI